MESTDEEIITHPDTAVTSNWHRAFIGHAVGCGNLTPHSHCPHCGNEVGEASTACARCGRTFTASRR